jgi:hypothetical protein
MTIKNKQIPSSHQTTFCLFSGIFVAGPIKRPYSSRFFILFSSDFFLSALFDYNTVRCYTSCSLSLSRSNVISTPPNYSCAECHTLTLWPEVSAIVNPTGIEILIRMPTCRQGFFDSELFIPILFTSSISFFEMDKFVPS